VGAGRGGAGGGGGGGGGGGRGAPERPAAPHQTAPPPRAAGPCGSWGVFSGGVRGTAPVGGFLGRAAEGFTEGARGHPPGCRSPGHPPKKHIYSVSVS
jgi:phage tail tape-measure protein